MPAADPSAHTQQQEAAAAERPEFCCGIVCVSYKVSLDTAAAWHFLNGIVAWEPGSEALHASGYRLVQHEQVYSMVQ